MAIYTSPPLDQPSKPATGAQYPDRAVDLAAWRRLEPLVTAEQMRSEYLFGIPLASPIRDPVTGKAAVMTDPMLTRFIEKAVNVAETEANVDIFPVQHSEKHPFDRAEYENFGFLRTEHRPVSSIEAFTVRPSNDVDVFEVPLVWVEANYLAKGQLFIVPLTVAIVNGQVTNTQGGGGAIFLSLLGSRGWLPAFWNIIYTSGWRDGNLPHVVNAYVGTIAAMNILSQLAAAHALSSSFSLGLDGSSQSVSTPGPQLYAQRLEELKAEREQYRRTIRQITGQGPVFSSNV